jgi:ABC-type bacteriocin/lantibiotic exporter with double-glycine peptidase domain
VPQQGEIFMNGSAYSTLNNADVRRRIGYIPQTPVLMNRSIYENIVYGLPEEPSKEVVETLMRDLGLGQFLDKLPQGLDTSVGVHGSKLSGGQRQITWVLKAILMNPEIIIMDEPTSAVDEETKGVLHYLLENVMEGKTVIMITHDKYLLKFADRVVTMKSGIIVSDERA